MRDGPKAPKGKLYAKYHNLMRSLKSSGLIEATKKSSEKNLSSDIFQKKRKCFGKLLIKCFIFAYCLLIHVLEAETDIEHILNSLKHDNCTFTEVEYLWNKSVNYRLKSIRESQSTTETLLYWHSYKLPAGYKLVRIFFFKDGLMKNYRY